MSLRTVILVAAAFGLSACGSADTSGAADAERELREANARYDRAIVARDRAALEELLADDYSLVTAEAQQRDRAGTLAQLTSGDTSIASEGSRDVSIRWLGDHALVTGRFRARVTTGGHSFPVDERYSSVWSRQDGRWRLRHEHASQVPQRP